jgi:endonuclease YncB( thermonuclease family)
MTGIDAPDRGHKMYDEAAGELSGLIENRKIWLEYDRYQDDKNGRVLAWVWVQCEGEPKFTPADYMHLTYNRSREGLKENPTGCKKGELVQEELVRAGLAKTEVYKDRGELKYEERIRMSDLSAGGK